MRLARLLGTRLTSVLTTSALVAAGLAVTVLAAPAASADTSSGLIDSNAAVVTSDALPTVQIDGVVWDQAVVGNTVWAGGQFANARPAGAAAGTNLTPRNNLLAYDITTGNLITTATVPTLNAQVKVVTASPDGTRIYVGGTFTTANGVNRYRIAAYNAATGALITSFAPTINATVSTIVATNTTVYVGGIFSSAGGQTRTRLAAFNATNGALTTWAPTADAGVNAMTLAGNKLIIGGSFQNVNGVGAYGLAALDLTTGALQPWATTSLIRNAGANAAILSLSTVGNVVYGTGYTFGAGGNLEGTFSANADTGTVNWVEDCHGDTYDQYATASTVYTVSHAHYCGNLGGFPQSDPWSVNMKHAVAFTTNATGTLGHDPYGYYDYYGTPSPSMINWFPDLSVGTYTGKGQAAWSITGSGDYVVVGGEFPKVNGVAQQGLVRFATKGKSPAKEGPEYTGSKFTPSVLALPSGANRIAWQANTDPDDLALHYELTRNNVLVYATDDSSPFWNRPTLGFIDSTAVPGTTYTYRLTATDNDGNIAKGNAVTFTTPAAGAANAYSKRVVADGAATYLPMNETTGSVLLDNAGFNDADLFGGITRSVTPGAVSTDAATAFDGANGTYASTRTAVQAPNTFTAQVWIKTTTTSGGKILGFGNSQTGNSGSYDRHLYMDNAGRIFFGVYTGSTATLNSAAGLNDGQWHQITATMGADGMKLYVDAKLVGSRTDVTAGQAFTGYWRVGGDNVGGWPNQPTSNYFAGSIDEVAIYPTVLTRTTVDAQWVASGRTSTIPASPTDAYGTAVFNDNPLLFWRLGETTGTTAADSGQNGDQTGIYQNGVVLGTAGGIKGTANTAASFDGSNDLVASTNSYANPTNYTEEAWFKTTSTNGGKIIGFGDQQNGTSNNYDRHVYMTSDGKVTFGVWTGQANTITTPTALNDGVWHHVVATQSTTDGMKLYIDGAQVGSNGQTGSQAYNGYWRVGGDTQWGCCSAFLTSTIDDVAVYNSVLTAAQVANHFNLGNTVVAPNRAPVAAFTSNAVYLDATFDGSTSADSDGSIAGYAWNFGDGSTSTLAAPTHSYATAGTYNVTLTVTDNLGETNVKTAAVTVTAPPANVAPTATFTVSSPSALTRAVDASSSADSDGTIVSYAWNFGDGATATGVTASHAYTAAGSFVITLLTTDNKGATGATTQTVTVTAPANQAPKASFVASPAQLTVSLDGTGSTDADGTIAGYAWDFGDSTAGTGATTSHTYTAAGIYTVTLTVTDNAGAKHASSQPVQVTAPPVNTPPAVDFTVVANALTVNLDSTSTDDGSITGYQWAFGDGASSADASTVHTYGLGGTYTVTLTATDNSGASASKTKTVVVTAPPAANVAPTAAFSTTASNLAVSFDAAASSDSDGTVAAYAWDYGDGLNDSLTTSAASHTYAAAGTYTVILTVTDNQGATNETTKIVTVTSPAAALLVNDTFGRTTTNAFGSADTGGAWTVAGGAANFSVGTGTGKIKMASAGAGPSASLGTVSAGNIDATFEVSLDKAMTGGGAYVSLGARKIGNSDYRTKVWFKADGTLQISLVKVVNGTSTALRSVNITGVTYTAGAKLNIRFQVSGSSSVLLNSKVWLSGAAEPAAWQASATDNSAPLADAGGFALYPYLSGTATNAPITASFDNLRVQALAG